MPQIIIFNGQLVRISQKNKSIIETSHDSLTWSQRGRIGGSFKSILQVGNRVLGTATDGVYRSSDLSTWSKIASESKIVDIAVMNNRIIGITEDGRTLRSSDGLTWS